MNATGRPIRREKRKSRRLPIGYSQSEAPIFAVLGMVGCGALIAAALWGASPGEQTRETLAETRGSTAPAQVHSGQIAADSRGASPLAHSSFEPEALLTTNRDGFDFTRSNSWTQTRYLQPA